MDRGRPFRGWIAAITVASLLTLCFLAVEKHIQIPTHRFFVSPQSVLEHSVSTSAKGILLTVDPGLAGTQQFPPTDLAPLVRQPQDAASGEANRYLRRPPEPAASVVLRAPQASVEFSELPLHASNSSIDYLMDTMDDAFASPVKTVSAQRISGAGQLRVDANRLANLPSPASLTGRMPEPKSLLEELSQLQNLVDPRSVNSFPSNAASRFVTTQRPIQLNVQEAEFLTSWIGRVQTLLHRIVVLHGLEHTESRLETSELVALAAQARQFGGALTDYDLAAQILRVAYSLERRLVVWHAIQRCLDSTSIALDSAQPTHLEVEKLELALQNVHTLLGGTGDGPTWSEYLMLQELNQWVASEQNVWSEGNALALKVLSRLNWERLTSKQREFLSRPEFTELAKQLGIWSRDPVDYRQLLSEIEDIETYDLSRSATSIAGAVQVLRNSNEEPQRLLAAALNDHYRNANMRVSVAGELLQRLLPEGKIEVRPVRQRILGADTRGDSAVQTQLSLKLIPDDSAWNLGIGVTGDLLSNTQSSKGPATFHNTSTAEIQSHRYVRMDATGYQISSEPTNVQSNDYLRKMSTDFDNLPIVGDFLRLIVREQFDQKRGLAQRITRRLIAQEADAELDRRLEESLQTASDEVEKRLVGPLENMRLNPMVVAMNTNEERLAIRYRVSNEMQLASHTPRPRAPAESLLSLQIHQSAINNTISQMGLGGKAWTIPELYEHLGNTFQQTNWRAPTDVPPGLTIRFASNKPAYVEMVDGKLRLSLRISQLQQDNHFDYRSFVVTVTYIPVADGMHAELIRDGVVEIQSVRNGFRQVVPLRVIFGKVFADRDDFPLISEEWQTDPRAEGLAVSQVEIRDGWLAVAISKAGSTMAAEVAARGREIKAMH